MDLKKYKVVWVIGYITGLEITAIELIKKYGA